MTTDTTNNTTENAEYITIAGLRCPKCGAANVVATGEALSDNGRCLACGFEACVAGFDWMLPGMDALKVLDVDQLRGAMLDLLTRANTALEYKPSEETAAEYAERLQDLSTEVYEVSFQLAHAVTALRVLVDASQRVCNRQAALGEVFSLECVVTWEFSSEAGTLALWGEQGPVFPALGMDFRPQQVEEDRHFHPF